jgi:hypothetical protein
MTRRGNGRHRSSGGTRFTGTRWLWLVVVVGIVLLAVAAVLVLRSGSRPPTHPVGPPASRSGGGPSPTQPVAVPLVTAARLAQLPQATTDATIADTPLDTDRASGTDGEVVHNPTPVPVFVEPGGAAFARLPATQAGSATWLPVIDRQPGWVRVLLPNRPNSAAGWLAASQVQPARTPYEIRVHVGVRTLELVREGHRVGRWSIAVGAPATPTPTGRTFLLASVIDRTQSFSPVILPLGAHSPTLTTFDGGPATTALHTWRDRGVYGRAVSNGCLRVPRDALRLLINVPLGTLVRIDP